MAVVVLHSWVVMWSHLAGTSGSCPQKHATPTWVLALLSCYLTGTFAGSLCWSQSWTKIGFPTLASNIRYINRGLSCGQLKCP